MCRIDHEGEAGRVGYQLNMFSRIKNGDMRDNIRLTSYLPHWILPTPVYPGSPPIPHGCAQPLPGGKPHHHGGIEYGCSTDAEPQESADG